MQKKLETEEKFNGKFFQANEKRTELLQIKYVSLRAKDKGMDLRKPGAIKLPEGWKQEFSEEACAEATISHDVVIDDSLYQKSMFAEDWAYVERWGEPANHGDTYTFRRLPHNLEQKGVEIKYEKDLDGEEGFWVGKKTISEMDKFSETKASKST